jgi:hypothetical protein
MTHRNIVTLLEKYSGLSINSSSSVYYKKYKIATSKFDIIDPEDYFILNQNITHITNQSNITFNITSDADYFNNVTIVLPCNITTTDIASIKVYNSFHIIDELYGDTHISTLCALFGKQYKIGSRIIPLICAPFYENNLVPIKSVDIAL